MISGGKLWHVQSLAGLSEWMLIVAGLKSQDLFYQTYSSPLFAAKCLHFNSVVRDYQFRSYLLTERVHFFLVTQIN